MCAQRVEVWIEIQVEETGHSTLHRSAVGSFLSEKDHVSFEALTSCNQPEVTGHKYQSHTQWLPNKVTDKLSRSPPCEAMVMILSETFRQDVDMGHALKQLRPDREDFVQHSAQISRIRGGCDCFTSGGIGKRKDRIFASRFAC